MNSVLSLEEGYGEFGRLLVHVDVTLLIDLVLNLTWVVFWAAEMRLMSMELVPVFVGLLDDWFDVVVPGLVLRQSVRL